MARVGQNPAKSAESIRQPEDITVCILTHIPFQSGYYENSLDVLKASINSLHKNTTLPFDLMVFDNNSCAEVKEYLIRLQDDKKIQQLILSDENVGKGGGWNHLFGAAQGNIVAISDSDILYHKGWLKESIGIIQDFPNVGMVTGRPLYTPVDYYTSTQKWAENTTGVNIDRGKLIPWDLYLEHTLSLGKSVEETKELYEKYDIEVLDFKEKKVVMGAAHFQFVTQKSVLQSIGFFDWDKPLGQTRELDKRINENGYLRLSTIHPYTKHIGNTLDDSGQEVSQAEITKNKGFDLFEVKIVKKILMKIYNWIFKRYF